MLSRAVYSILASSLSLLAVTSAHAQDATNPAPKAVEASSEGGDIVVTARRRDERLLNVPVAVTVATGEQLTNRSVRTVEDIARLAPSTFIGATARGAQTATINIRGLENTGGAITNDPAVGVYFDEVYLGRTAGNLLASVYDMASVQVLRGPQGTLFGRNNTGGALILTPVRPDLNNIGGEFDATLGSFNRHDFSGILNVPIVDGKLAIRGSWRFNKQDGYGTSLVTGINRYGDRDNNGGRIALRWQAADDAVFDLTYDRTRVHETGPLIVNLGSLIAGQTFYQSQSGDTDPTSEATIQGLTLKGEIKLQPDMSLKVIGGYRKLKTELRNDTDGLPITAVDTEQFAGQHQYSGEVQLSGTMLRDAATIIKSLQYTAGLFYFKEDGYDGSSLPRPYPVPGNPLSAASYRNINATNESAAAYAQFESNTSDKLFLTAGLRRTLDKRDADNQGLRLGACNLIALGPNFATVPANSCKILGSRRFRYWSYSFGARFQINRDVNVYVKYDKADRAGGLQGIPTEFISYEVESVKSIEGGLKAQFFNNRFSTNLAVFESTIPNIQRATVITVTPSGQTITPAAVITNVGTGRVKGFEIEAAATPVRGLRFEGSLGYLDAYYTKLTNPAFIARQAALGSPLEFPDTSKWTVGGAITYEAHLAGVGDLMLRSDYQHRTAQRLDALNNTGLTQPGYGILNARIQLTFGDLPIGKDVMIAAFGRNLTRAQYNVFGSLVVGPIVIRGEPRTFGGELRVRF